MIEEKGSRCALIISHYIWVLIVILFCLIGVAVTPMQETGVINSAQPTHFDENKDPKLFSHITDIHLNTFTKIHNEDFLESLNISKRMGSKSVIFTGDIVDNWGSAADDFIVYGNQYVPDYENFKEVIESFNFTDLPLIDLPGNHDEYGVLGFDKESHYFIHYSHFFNISEKNFTKEEFQVGTIEVGGDTFLYINPYEWPLPHAKLGFWINAGKDLLDAIEKEFQKPVTEGNRYVISHFPVELWSERYKSTSGKTFKQMCKENSIDMILTGHLHPSEKTIMHHNGTLEVVGSDIVSHDKFGVVINDNDFLSYHDIDIHNPPEGLITVPVEKNLLSKNIGFASNPYIVRALVFGDEDANITYDGDEKGRLTKIREVSKGVYLYQDTIDLPDGEHTLHFHGDIEQTITFYYGKSVNLGKETIYGFPNIVTTGIVIFGLFIFFDIFITFPLPPIESVKEYEEWIDTGKSNFSIIKKVLLSIFGIIPVRNRLQTSSIITIFTLFICSILPAFIPVVFFSDESTVGAVFIWGYVIGGKYHYDVYGTLFGAVYYAAILLPIILGAAQMNKRGVFNFVIGIVDMLIGFIIGLFVGLTWGIQSSGICDGVLSPLFIIVPVIAIVISIIFQMKKRNQTSSFALLTV